MYTPPEVKEYRERVASHALAAMRAKRLKPFEYAWVIVGVYNVRLDLDNAVAELLDGMNGIVYPNDGRVVILHLFKLRDKKGPRATVHVEEAQKP
jgi:Holliday junction resolvase RusA-like endonuclease